MWEWGHLEGSTHIKYWWTFQRFVLRRGAYRTHFLNRTMDWGVFARCPHFWESLFIAIIRLRSESCNGITPIQTHEWPYRWVPALPQLSQRIFSVERVLLCLQHVTHKCTLLFCHVCALLITWRGDDWSDNNDGQSLRALLCPKYSASGVWRRLENGGS